MAIVAEVIDQKAIPGSDTKTALVLQVVVYDDTDTEKRPLTVPLDITIDQDGFMEERKTQEAMRTAIAAEVNARLSERKASLEKSATVAKSLVGLVVPLGGVKVQR